MKIDSEEEARKKFMLFAGVRLAGLAIFLLGVFIAFTDLIVPGGQPVIGGLLAMAGAIDAVLAPAILKRMTNKP